MVETSFSDNSENENTRPLGASRETINIGNKEYYNIPEAGTVVEVPDSSSSSDNYSESEEREGY